MAYFSRCSPLKRFEENKKLASVTVSRMFPHLPADVREDYMTEALLGLWHACERFDPLRGFAFSTYAVTCMRGHLLYFYGKQKLHEERCTVSLSVPTVKGSTETLADLLPAPTEEQPLHQLLHAERMEKARRTWDRKASSWKRRRMRIAEETAAVLGRQE